MIFEFDNGAAYTRHYWVALGRTIGVVRGLAQTFPLRSAAWGHAHRQFQREGRVIFANGGATAVYVPGLSLSYYRHADWLGSARFASTPSRALRYSGAYAPFGENYAETGTTERSFTGQNQDTVSSGSYPLYDFMFREYHPVQGRWLSPDPLAGDILNPQSFPERAGIFENRYAYVLNNPTNFIDQLRRLTGCCKTDDF